MFYCQLLNVERFRLFYREYFEYQGKYKNFKSFQGLKNKEISYIKKIGFFYQRSWKLEDSGKMFLKF